MSTSGAAESCLETGRYGQAVREVDYWKGKKNYPRWIASWREGDRIRTVYLGSCRKIGGVEVLRTARKMKADILATERHP